MGTYGPDIFGYFWCKTEVFLVKSVLGTPVGTKIFVEFFSIMSLTCIVC